MARYSPRDPGFTDSPTLGDALASLARSGGAAQEEVEERRRLEDERERERTREDEDRELELFQGGFTREPRREPVPEDEDIFSDALPGLETAADPRRRPPDVFEDAGIGMQSPAEGALGQIEQGGVPPEPSEPQLLAVPGAYVEGMGFTPKAITDQDFVAQNRARAREIAGPRTRVAPGVEQVTDDLFFDEQRTPEFREGQRDRAAQTERQARLEAVLGAVGSGEEQLPPELLAEGLELGIPSSMLRPGGGREEQTIRVNGRDFPNTEEGERAALAWREAVAEAGRTGSGASGAGERITGETTRRTLATAAARAIQSIRQDVAELSPFERRNLEAGQIQQQIQGMLALFGFTSVPELEQEMRELRLSGTAPPTQGASGGGSQGASEGASEFEVDPAIVDAVMEENPDATEEELTELVIQRMQGGG